MKPFVLFYGDVVVNIHTFERYNAQHYGDFVLYLFSLQLTFYPVIVYHWRPSPLLSIYVKLLLAREFNSQRMVISSQLSKNYYLKNDSTKIELILSAFSELFIEINSTGWLVGLNLFKKNYVSKNMRNRVVVYHIFYTLNQVFIMY